MTGKIVFGRETVHIAGVNVARDEAWAADDPFVRDHPDAFADVPTKPRRTVAPAAQAERAVERATRAPGERRGAGTKQADRW